MGHDGVVVEVDPHQSVIFRHDGTKLHQRVFAEAHARKINMINQIRRVRQNTAHIVDEFTIMLVIRIQSVVT